MRTGSCRRCGRCCIDASRLQYHVQTFILPGEPNYDTLIPLPLLPRDPAINCEKLVFDIQTRKAVCLIHDQKPPVCARYPISVVDRMDGCGFSFEEDVHVSG